MDARSAGRNNSRHAARIPNRQTERPIRPIHAGPSMRFVWPPTRVRTAHPRSPLRLGYATRGRGKTYAVLEVREETMHFESIPTTQAAGIYVATQIESAVAASEWPANDASTQTALASLVSPASPPPPSSTREHQSSRQWVRDSSAYSTACLRWLVNSSEIVRGFA
jgi:hypothetical protein